MRNPFTGDNEFARRTFRRSLIPGILVMAMAELSLLYAAPVVQLFEQVNLVDAPLSNQQTRVLTPVLAGSGQVYILKIRNAGPGDLEGIAISVEGTHAAETTLGGTGFTFMEAGLTNSFSLTWNPVAAGLREVTLRVVSSGSPSPFLVPLQMTATQPVFQLESPEGTPLTSGGGVDFGKIPDGLSQTLFFTVRNTGNGPLLSTQISVEGLHASEITRSDAALGSIGPGETGTFDLTWEPAAAGTRSAALRLTSTDASRSPFIVNLTAEGTAPAPRMEVHYPFGTARASGYGIDFGTVAPGAEQVETLYFVNTGNLPLNSMSVTKGGPHASEVTFGLQQSEEPAKAVLLPGENQTLWVAFRPQSPGLHTATLTLNSNDAERSPFEIELSITATPFPRPDVAVGENSAKLRGMMAYGTPASQKVLVIAAKAKPVSAIAVIGNRSITQDPMRVIARRGTRLFKAAYFEGSANITSTLTTGRYQTPALSSATPDITIRLDVTPNRSVLVKSFAGRPAVLRRSFSTLVRATSMTYPAGDAGLIQVQTR